MYAGIPWISPCPLDHEPSRGSTSCVRPWRGSPNSDVWYADHQPNTPPMNDKQNPRTIHARFRVPRTWGELAIYVGFALIIPVTLFALAHPALVVGIVTGATAGLLARPLHRRLTRQPEHRSGDSERSSDAVAHTVTQD